MWRTALAAKQHDGCANIEGRRERLDFIERVGALQHAPMGAKGTFVAAACLQ